MADRSNVLTLSHETHTWVWYDGKYTRRPVSHYLDFVIDGVPLRQRVPEAAGLVTDLNRAWLPQAVDEAVEILLGQRPHPSLGSGRVAVLVCGVCGDLGCGALTCTLHVGGAMVRWSDWRWCYGTGESPSRTELPMFCFDRRSYGAGLRAAPDRIRHLPYDDLEHGGKRFLWPWQWGWRSPRGGHDPRGG